MKTLPISSYNNNSTFKGLHVTNPDVQKLLLTKLNSKQLDELSQIIKEQQNNSVHILLDSKNGKRFDASLVCLYRIQDFKTKYKQIPLFESKFNFIKRIVNVANEYNRQLQNLKVLKLKWDYPLLQEWVTKMYL